MAADDDRGAGLVLADQLDHLGNLDLVGDDAADTDDVVALGANLLEEALARGEVEQRAGGLDVGLDEHQPPRTMEHPQREGTLHTGNLVVIKLHRIHRPAAVLIVLTVRTVDAGEQNLRA